jgi:2-phosphoglycerate kinase
LKQRMATSAQSIASEYVSYLRVRVIVKTGSVRGVVRELVVRTLGRAQGSTLQDWQGYSVEQDPDLDIVPSATPCIGGIIKISE